MLLLTVRTCKHIPYLALIIFKSIGAKSLLLSRIYESIMKGTEDLHNQKSKRTNTDVKALVQMLSGYL